MHTKGQNILNLTHNLESNALESIDDLTKQGIYLNKTNQNVDQINKQLTKLETNLNELKKISNRKTNLFRLCSSCLSCFCKYFTNNLFQKEQHKFELVEDHLPEERIQKEWCIRFNPEERWIKHVELGLNRLIEIAEEMKKTFQQQTELTEQMYNTVKINRIKMKNSKREMIQLHKPNK